MRKGTTMTEIHTVRLTHLSAEIILRALGVATDATDNPDTQGEYENVARVITEAFARAEYVAARESNLAAWAAGE